MTDEQWEYRIRALRMRPRFRMRVDRQPSQIMEELRRCADNDQCPFVIQLHDCQAEVTVPDSQQHFWSPYLNLLIEDEDDGTELDGRFGPNISVWTMFVAAYAILGITGSVGLLMGLSQMSLGQQSWGFALALGCLIGIALVYAVALVGQRLAADQMSQIRRYIERSFGDASGKPSS